MLIRFEVDGRRVLDPDSYPGEVIIDAPATPGVIPRGAPFEMVNITLRLKVHPAWESQVSWKNIEWERYDALDGKSYQRVRLIDGEYRYLFDTHRFRKDFYIIVKDGSPRFFEEKAGRLMALPEPAPPPGRFERDDVI